MAISVIQLDEARVTASELCRLCIRVCVSQGGDGPARRTPRGAQEDAERVREHDVDAPRVPRDPHARAAQARERMSLLACSLTLVLALFYCT